VTSDRDARLRALVAALDAKDHNDAEDAQLELTRDFGAEALQPLLAVAPTFSDFGRRCAIEVFESIGDQRAAPVLVPWLRSENEVVRSWSAEALGLLHAGEAVPDLLAAWAAAKQRGTPPGWGEPCNIRRALHKLGARDVVLPQTLANLAVEARPFDYAWPADQLGAVLEGLAAAGQVVTFIQFWRRRDDLNRDTWYAMTEASTTMELDWTTPWDQLVAASLTAGTHAARAITGSGLPPGAIVTANWVDQSDI
jgi:hypothetical protein